MNNITGDSRVNLEIQGISRFSPIF